MCLRLIAETDARSVGVLAIAILLVLTHRMHVRSLCIVGALQIIVMMTMMVIVIINGGIVV